MFERIRPLLSYLAVLILVAIAGTLLPAGQAFAGELAPRQLSEGEWAIIYSSAALTFEIGLSLRPDRDLNIGEYTPPGIDRMFRKLLHGNRQAKTNFLDNKFGSAVSPTVALMGICVLDINRSEFSNDVPMFVCGVAATKGITDISKSLVKRPRPCCVAQSSGECNDDIDHASQSHSFFSGHSSSVFYTATFFNRRFRRHMRQNWTQDEYRIGRVVTPLLSFGWATFVGLSRIHADRHYFTDVAAGALAGALLGEVFFRLAYESVDMPQTGSAAPLFLIRIPLN